jgi:hypothetical protein
MSQTIDVIQVNDWKMDGGLIAVPVDAQIAGSDGKVTLRFDIEAAKNLIGRLQAGIVTASNINR